MFGFYVYDAKPVTFNVFISIVYYFLCKFPIYVYMLSLKKQVKVIIKAIMKKIPPINCHHDSIDDCRNVPTILSFMNDNADILKHTFIT